MNKLAAMGVADEEMANNIFAVLITATVEISHGMSKLRYTHRFHFDNII